MDAEEIFQTLLILTALLMAFFLLKEFLGASSPDDDEYSGLARSPEELYEPTEEAISEMESLISKLN